MRIWATHTYENSFEMEVPDDATPEEIRAMIVEEDDCLGGDWTTDYEIPDGWED